jgi:cyclopropane-fatty-acyl-phospholipid synthase
LASTKNLENPFSDLKKYKKIFRMNPKQLSLHLLGLAGIEVNGKNPWDIQVHDDRLWNRIISQRELGLAEAYMDGWWDVESIDQFLTKLLEINVLDKAPFSISLIGHAVKSTVLNRQTKAKAAANAKHHYNIGNDLYARMLDKEMAYSCGYWKSAKTLDQAQIAKFDLICRKLELKPGMKLLDIGCGWGGLLRYAAKNYGIIGTGISPADNQIELARAKNGKLKIEYLQMDYRDLSGNFDRIVSVGMMEHVGPKNLETFFNKCISLLAPDGMMLHHTIASNETKQVTDPFFDRYIFPGGVLPSLAQISKAVEKKVIIEDVHNFGPDYEKTLLAWHANINNKRWREIPNYDERFRRMWNYYLLSSAAGFRARHIQLIQVVFRQMNSRGAYKAVR